MFLQNKSTILFDFFLLQNGIKKKTMTGNYNRVSTKYINNT